MLFILVPLFGTAQGKDYLLLYKPGKSDRYTYLIGQEIIIKPVRNFPLLRGVISRFGDSSIFFGHHDSIHFTEIESIVINPDTRLFGRNAWLSNLIITTGSIGIWQLSYWVNAGSWSPDIRSAPGIIAFTTLTPILVNRIAVLVRRSKCEVSNGTWRLGVVKMPSG